LVRENVEEYKKSIEKLAGEVRSKQDLNSQLMVKEKENKIRIE
jgi:hypothetical protein